MEIVPFPHPALRWKSKPVREINAQLRATIREMFDLMYEARGVGLAANQVALPLRLFVMNPTGDAEEPDAELVFINPEITQRKGSAEGEEGCLSFPELYGQVRRAEEIAVEAFDVRGHAFTLSLDELKARVVQHENDHLDGVLFPDRMTDTARLELAPQLEEFEAAFRRRQEAGLCPSDEELKAAMRGLEPV
ncbi:MAG: peptide deformylase [Planctomycetaceae bacterium]